MAEIVERIKNRPVLIAALIEAIIGTLIAFGADITGEQQTAILALSGAIVAIAFGVQASVTPTRKLRQ